MFKHVKRALVIGSITFIAMTTGSLLPEPFNFIVPFSIMIGCIVLFISWITDGDTLGER